VNFRPPLVQASPAKKALPSFLCSIAPIKSRRTLMQSTLRKSMITEEKQCKPLPCGLHNVSAPQTQRGELVNFRPPREVKKLCPPLVQASEAEKEHRLLLVAAVLHSNVAELPCILRCARASSPRRSNANLLLVATTRCRHCKFGKGGNGELSPTGGMVNFRPTHASQCNSHPRGMKLREHVCTAGTPPQLAADSNCISELQKKETALLRRGHSTLGTCTSKKVFLTTTHAWSQSSSSSKPACLMGSDSEEISVEHNDSLSSSPACSLPCWQHVPGAQSDRVSAKGADLRR